MLVVEQWAELRRLHFVGKVSIKELARRYAVDRNTVRRAIRSSEPPRYERAPQPSKLDPFKDEIHRLLHDAPRLPNTRVGELIAPLGYHGHQTILDAYLREVRPLFLPAVRTYQRTTYRPGELAQFDLWQPARELPIGFGQTRRGYVMVGALGYSRIGAGALVFSKEAPDLLWAMARCLRAFGGLPETLVTDREGALHAGDGKPTEPYAAFCGQLPVAWRFCAPADPEAKGVIAIGHAATKRVRSELTAEGDARAETVIRQFEWAVNDVAGLREKLEQAQQEQATSAARVRPTAGRNSSNASCFVIASRPGRRRMPWPTLPYRIPHRPPAPVELRWALHDDGPLAWLDLGADDPDALPARVRVLERDGNVIAVSDPAVHGASRDGIGRTASLVLPAPAQLADALRSGALADYRFEALIAHRWVGVRLTPRADRPEHRQARPRLAPELGLQRVHGDVAHHQQQHHDRDDDPDPLEIPHHERPLRRGGTLEHCRWLADSA